MSFMLADPTSHILPHDLFRIGPLWVTNHMLMATVAGALMLLIFPTLFRRPDAQAPRGSRNFFEAILEFLRVEVFRPALKENTDRFVPFLWTLFFFILFCNLLGFMPLGEILGLINPKLSHYAGTATGNVSTTGALALCTLIMIHASGIVQVARALINGTYGHGHHEEHSSDGKHGHEAAHDLEHVRGEGLSADVPAKFDALKNPTRHYEDDEPVGHGHQAVASNGGAAFAHHGMNPVAAILCAVPLYLWNFAPHPFKPQPGQSAVMWIPDILIWGMLLVLELVGAMIKPFALMIRLFANMIAGHLVLAVLITFIPVTLGVFQQTAVGIPITILSLLIRLLELFVSFLQAYIFTFLATLFIASAVAPEH
ncbi:MAG TPA: F0F1 ATP synthase subunit A [Tepidisphaeraceae bacterium]|jgi:F0F1-type ATP synthase membrane subunit a